MSFKGVVAGWVGLFGWTQFCGSPLAAAIRLMLRTSGFSGLSLPATVKGELGHFRHGCLERIGKEPDEPDQHKSKRPIHAWRIEGGVGQVKPLLERHLIVRLDCGH